MPDKEVEIKLTGITKKEFRAELFKRAARCYICKRHAGRGEDKSVAIIGEDRISITGLQMVPATRKHHNVTLKYTICHECAWLFKLWPDGRLAWAGSGVGDAAPPAQEQRTLVPLAC